MKIDKIESLTEDVFSLARAKEIGAVAMALLLGAVLGRLTDS